MELSLFNIHFALCIFMTGLIWGVQVVHYPSFIYIDKSQFCNFVSFHGKRISWIVMPIMLLELFTGLLLFLDLMNWKNSANLLFNILIFLSTFLLSVPIHQSLSKARNVDLIHQLVWTNWARTFLWSVRTVFLFILA